MNLRGVAALAATLLAAAAASARADQLADPKGAFRLGPTTEWAFHGDPDDGAQLECLFELCAPIPSVIRRQFCGVAVERLPSSSMTDERLKRGFSKAVFELGAKGISNDIVTLQVDGEPQTETRASGIWSFAFLQGQTAGGAPLNGVLYLTGRGATLFSAYCFYQRADWPKMQTRLEILLDTLVWTPSR